MLEKITKANNIELRDKRFSANFVEKIDDQLIADLNKETNISQWTVFQHSFLIKDFNDKSLNVDMYDLLAKATYPMVIV